MYYEVGGIVGFIKAGDKKKIKIAKIIQLPSDRSDQRFKVKFFDGTEIGCWNMNLVSLSGELSGDIGSQLIDIITQLDGENDTLKKRIADAKDILG